MVNIVKELEKKKPTLHVYDVIPDDKRKDIPDEYLFAFLDYLHELLCNLYTYNSKYTS